MAIASAPSVAELLRVVTESAQEVIGTHQAVTSRLVHGWREANTHVTLSDKYAHYRNYNEVPKGLGVLNYVTRENRPLRLNRQQLVQHPEWRGLRDAPDHPPLPDYLAAPLVGSDGSNLGLIQLADKIDGSDFSADDEAILVQLAQVASANLERLEALQREQATRLQLEALYDTGRAVAARLDLEQIVQLVTDSVTQLTEAEFGAFFYNVMGEEGEGYMLYALSGASREDFAGFPMPRNSPLFEPTFRGEAVVRVDDVTQHPRFGRNPPHYGFPPGHLPVRSYLAVPVVAGGGEVFGGLFFGHPQPGRFREEHERAALAIAAQAAAAIDNARLYQAAQREIEARQRAFTARDHVARVLQQSLLPPQLPTVPGVQLRGWYQVGQGGVGGDFYDVFPLVGGDWGVVIGDVCGKGVEAAAFTALARHTVRTAAMIHRHPSQVLRVLNRAVRYDDAMQGFCTAAYARMHPRPNGMALTVASGGHPPWLLRRRDGSVQTASSTGTLLGFFPEVEVAGESVELAPGEVLVFYTDGVTDVLDEDPEEGEAALLAMVAEAGADAGELTRLLEAEWKRGKAAYRSDDAALLVIQCE